MRLKRICEVKPSGKCAVSDEIREQFSTGNRDELSLALCTALKEIGFENTKKTRDAVRMQFTKNIAKIHEKSRQREEEIQGGWFTEEKMSKELHYSASLGCIARTLNLGFILAAGNSSAR